MKIQFKQKKDVTTFGALKYGETFILPNVGDCSVDTRYYDCVCVKIRFRITDVAANLTLNRIERCENSTEVERVSFTLIEE